MVRLVSNNRLVPSPLPLLPSPLPPPMMISRITATKATVRPVFQQIFKSFSAAPSDTIQVDLGHAFDGHRKFSLELTQPSYLTQPS